MSLVTMTLLLLLAALVLYAVLGGADFGAGIWEFNTALKADERERDLLYHAIGPVWETNHVWLIFVLVLLFGAFPPAFAAINAALIVPLLLGLVGIVFRGAAYAFRSQLKSQPKKQRVWIAVFAIASVMAPFFLGAAVGAIASGKLEFQDGQFSGDHLWGWVNSLSVFVGFFTVGLCAYVAAVLMIREARMAKMEDLVVVWRRRSLWTGVGLGLLAACGLALVAFDYEQLREGLKQRGWPAVVTSVSCGLLSLWAIYTLRLSWAVVFAMAASAMVVIGWGFAQYPFVVPPVWTAEAAASHPNVLKLILGVSAIGMAMLIPAIVLLFKIFKSEKQTAEILDDHR